MSISSPIQPPGAQPSSSAGAPQPAPPGTGAKVILQYAEDSARQQQGTERQIIKGEVTKVGRDGTAQIQTERGPIEVQIQSDGRAPILRPGDRVEIDIPPRSAGRPPHEADIRVTERAPARSQQQAGQSTAPLRASETPVELAVEPPPPPPPPESATPAPRPELPPLEPGQPVRLQPLPPELAAQITLPEPEALPAVRLEAVRYTIMQALQNRMESLEDIPLRPVLSAQGEVRAQFLQTLPETPALQALAPPVLETAAQPQPVPGAVASALAPPFLPGAVKGMPEAPPLAPQTLPFLAISFQEPQAAIPQIVPASALMPPSPPGPVLIAATLENTVLPPGTAPVLARMEADGTPVPQPLAPLLVTQGTLASVLPASAETTAPSAPAELSLQVGMLIPPGPVLTDPSSEEFLRVEPEMIVKQGTKPDILIARVSGAVKNDIPVVTLSTPAMPGAGETPAALYILHTPGPVSLLLPGTELALEMPSKPVTLPLPGMAAGQTPMALPPYPIPFLSPELWPALDQIQQSLISAAPQAAASLANIMPNPGNPAQMMPAALFFIAAIRAGDLQGWLGDKALESLKSGGKSGLLSRLMQEGGALSRLGGEPLSGDWRGMAFPMAWQNEIHKVALYYKREDREDSDTEKGHKGTRFIMDLTLSRIGRVQLDGYMRGQNFDLILRTDQPFNAAARVAMQELYQGALEFEGLSGDLAFQSKPEQWVRITGRGESLVFNV